MVNVERILCPVDFSEASRYAVEHAVEAARRWNAQITIVYVHSVLVPWGPVPGIHGDVPVLPAPRPEEVTEKVHRSYPSLRARAKTDVVMATGSPAREIVRLAEEISADLVVMGTHGHGGFDRLVIGSVTEKVLRTTRIPVLTVSSQTRAAAATPSTYKTVLCAMDFSHASIRALQYALDVAKQTRAKVILLHVVEGIGDLPRETAHFNVPEYGAYRSQEAAAQLAAIIPDSARREYAVEDHITIGKPHGEILRVAAEVNADLIVMGVHGRGAKERWFGSTTSHVIREADCPVLTVRAASTPDSESGERRPS